jgi:hypothetical protein
MMSKACQPIRIA